MSPWELAKYAIVLKQGPDGQVAHVWIPLKDFDLTRFQQTRSTIHLRPGIMRVSS